MKICKKCGILKDINLFNKCKQNKDGYLTECKLCKSVFNKEYKNKNKEKLKIKNKEYYLKNKKKIEKYKEDNKEKIKLQRREHAIINRDRLTQYKREYIAKNRNKVNETHRKYVKSNLNVKFTRLLRKRILYVVKLHGGKKSASTIDLVGCSVDFFHNYLESKFTKGMTWENHGKNGWHVDHIIPCSSFDLTDPEQQKICFHYSNLQPLWATTKIAMKYGERQDYIGNLEKKDRIVF